MIDMAAAGSRPGISKAEMEIMQVLWEHGPGAIREVLGALPPRKHPWAYTTVQTMLNRLEAKGYVKSDKSTVPNVFRAAVSRDTLVKRRLRSLIDELCDGTALPLVSALVRDRHLTERDIQHFRKLLDEVEPGKK